MHVPMVMVVVATTVRCNDEEANGIILPFHPIVGCNFISGGTWSNFLLWGFSPQNCALLFFKPN